MATWIGGSAETPGNLQRAEICAMQFGEAQPCALGSHEEFITEHCWGYTAPSERTSEYRVEHPRWKIRPADSFELQADIATLYGKKFLELLEAKPVSAFIADGSNVESGASYHRAITRFAIHRVIDFYVVLCHLPCVA